MRDYAELVKALRYCGSPVTNEYNCNNCPWLSKCKEGTGENPLLKAADAIEELLKENAELDNSGRILMAAFARLKEKVPKWISVEERLPEIGRSVLLFNGSVHIGWRVDGQRYRFLSERFPDHPTHWMPLPEPPKEVVQGEP